MLQSYKGNELQMCCNRERIFKIFGIKEIIVCKRIIGFKVILF